MRRLVLVLLALALVGAGAPAVAQWDPTAAGFSWEDVRSNPVLANAYGVEYVPATAPATPTPEPEDPGSYVVNGGWDCDRPHSFTIHPNRLTPQWERLMRDVVTDVERRTGYSFPFAGVTPAAGELEIKLATRAEEPQALPGDGRVGTAIVYGRSGVYTKGKVIIDVAAAAGGEPAILMHELGHIAGLGHVDDEAQVMHPRAWRSRWGRGDLAGLAEVCR